MSQSPKHSTPFSVTDILSPLEESYKKAVAAAAAAAAENSGLGSAAAYRSPQSQTAMNVPVSNPYMHMSHPVNTFPAQYCNGTDISAHYGDVRQSASGWYGTPPDPRFASKCPLHSFYRFTHKCLSTWNNSCSIKLNSITLNMHVSVLFFHFLWGGSNRKKLSFLNKKKIINVLCHPIMRT